MGVAKTTFLLGLLTVLLLAIGYAVGYFLNISVFYTVTVAFIFAMLMNIFVFWYADKWVLKLYKVKIVSENEEPELHEIVTRLTKSAGMPKPRVGIIPSDILNAFATGRNAKNSVVAVTRGAMSHLNKDQLEGVIAHELAHIKNRDMLVNTMVAMIAGAIAYVAMIGRWSMFAGGGRRSQDGGAALLAILAMIIIPIAAVLVRLSVSRTREYGADAEGANISHKPRALADALRTLDAHAKGRPIQTGNPATSHMFIVNPFRGAGIVELFSTHPSTEKRIQRLEALATGREL